MTVDIVGIGKTQKKYPPAEKFEFENLHDYLEHAKKIIGYFAPKIRGGLAKEMLSSEDAISNVATAIMVADWTWDKDRVGKSGQKCTKHTYRNLRGIWAIKSYLVRQRRKSKHRMASINAEIDDEGGQLYSVLCDNSDLPIKQILKSELRELLEDMISCGIITQRQEEYLRLHYFSSMSYADIGKRNGVSRQAVHDAVNRAIKSLSLAVSPEEEKK